MTRRRRVPLARPLVYAWCVLVLAFLSLPLAIVFPISFSSSSYLQFPPPGWSTRWYEAYFGAREYATLVQLATQTLSTTNGLEESHLWRGRAYQALGKTVDAKTEFEAALKDNPNFGPAREALKALGG